jgi:hypothetical protein
MCGEWFHSVVCCSFYASWGLNSSFEWEWKFLVKNNALSLVQSD